MYLFLTESQDTHVYTQRHGKFMGFGPETVVVGSVDKMRLSCWKNLLTEFRIKLKTTKWINYILFIVVV